MLPPTEDSEVQFSYLGQKEELDSEKYIVAAVEEEMFGVIT